MSELLLRGNLDDGLQFVVHVTHDPGVGEGHHNAFFANVFDEVYCQRVIGALGTGWHAVTGNVFRDGRTGVFLRESANNTISGNHFSHMGPQLVGSAQSSNRTVVLDDCDHTTINGNLFDECEKGQVILRGTSGTALSERIQIISNQFHLAYGLFTIVNPILCKEGESDLVQIVGNAVLGVFGPLFEAGPSVTVNDSENWDS